MAQSQDKIEKGPRTQPKAVPNTPHTTANIELNQHVLRSSETNVSDTDTRIGQAVDQTYAYRLVELGYMVSTKTSKSDADAGPAEKEEKTPNEAKKRTDEPGLNEKRQGY